jgi:outer membrane immunogenic protein
MRWLITLSLTIIGLACAGVHAVAAPYSWTGFYLGGNVGAGFGTTETSANFGPAIIPAPATAPTTVANATAPATLATATAADPTTAKPVALASATATALVPTTTTANITSISGFTLPISSQTFNGLLGGFQGGYNWQVGFIVLGVEGDLDFADLQGAAPCLVVLNCTIKHDWVADITGRVGVVVVERALVYLKGGAAWESANFSAGNSITVGGTTFAANASVSGIQTGGLLGMGIEYAFLPNWSAKIEYNFIDFGSHTFNTPISTTPAIGAVGAVLAAGIPVSITENEHIIKAGVNYRFGDNLLY